MFLGRCGLKMKMAESPLEVSPPLAGLFRGKRSAGHSPELYNEIAVGLSFENRRGLNYFHVIFCSRRFKYL